MSLRIAYLFTGIFLVTNSPERCVLAGPKAPTSPGRQIEHKLTIVHPGDATGKPMPHTLLQILDKEDNPLAYSMWVDSVICRDKTCDVVKVQLHWDALGRYQRFEVAPGFQLTKLDHVPFSQQDLDKLQRILKDPESPLREVEKESMTAKAPQRSKKSDKSSAAVDGVSGATVLTLKTAVIIGAGYTCYDLWHWSNGLLTDHIRDFTGKNSSKEKLMAYLAAKDTDSVIFSLEYLRKRRIADKASFNAVVTRCKQGNETLLKPTMAYLSETAAEPGDYYDAIIKLFAESDSKKHLLILESLMSDKNKAGDGVTESDQKLLSEFYDRLCDYLPGLESYYEVHLFLTLMEKKNAGSSTVVEKAADLLKHKKFFVSRRAYWFLEKQNLPEDVRKRVDAYYSENEDRL